MFYKVELVTRKKNFCKIFWVSGSKSDFMLSNLIWQLDFVTGEFRTSTSSYMLQLYFEYLSIKIMHAPAIIFFSQPQIYLICPFLFVCSLICFCYSLYVRNLKMLIFWNTLQAHHADSMLCVCRVALILIPYSSSLYIMCSLRFCY